MTYTLGQIVLVNGERQVLINDEHDLPPVLPNLYFAQIINQAYSTMQRRARAVIQILNWARELKIDLFDRLRSGEGFTYAEQQSLVFNLRSRAEPNEDDPYVGADTYKDRCREVRKFFRFLARTYGDTRREKESYLIRVLSWIEDLFDFLSAHYVVMPPAKREGFSHTERQAMLELVHPSNENNPFHERVRERNWLIINLLFETGIRVGELLSLRCDAVVTEMDVSYGMLHFLVVNQNVYLNEDPRSVPPDAKTTSRKLPISEKLAMRIDHYIKTGRRYRGRNAQRAAAFLFLNSDNRPAPLSIGGFYKILSRIESVGNAHKTVFSHLQAHRFRYTTMEDLMRLLGVSKDNEEESKKIMRYMGGWSSTSDQYEHYAAKQIIFSAHLALLKLHDELIVKFDR